MFLVTNMLRFPEKWQTCNGVHGEARTLRTLRQFVCFGPKADAFIIDCDPSLTLKLAAVFLVLPFLRRPLIAVDLVLRRPETSVWDRLRNAVKRFLLSRVDHFVHYFKDLRGYEHYFGIGPNRSSYVPFKPNIRYNHTLAPDADGAYVLCFGRSLRDYDTFLEAMTRIPYPGAISRPNFLSLKLHGSRFTCPLERLPKNVEMLEDNGSTKALIQIIGNARVVVLPILAKSLVASGVGTYLDSMYMGKCVILTDGPGCSDVLTDNQCLFVPPEDSDALARMIRRVWEDDGLRKETAKRGYEYASALGGEPELRQRILEKTVAYLQTRSR